MTNEAYLKTRFSQPPGKISRDDGFSGNEIRQCLTNALARDSPFCDMPHWPAGAGGRE